MTLRHIYSAANGKIDSRTPTYNDANSIKYDFEDDFVDGNTIIIAKHGGLISTEKGVDFGKRIHDSFVTNNPNSNNSIVIHNFVWDSGIQAALDGIKGSVTESETLQDLIFEQIKEATNIDSENLKKISEKAESIFDFIANNAKKFKRFLHRFERMERSPVTVKEESDFDKELEQEIEILVKGDKELLDAIESLDDLEPTTDDHTQKAFGFILRYGSKLILSVVKRFLSGTDHGVATIMEEVLYDIRAAGLIHTIWRGIQSRSAGMYGYDLNSYKDDYCFKEALFEQGSGGIYLTRLNEALKTSPNIKIIVVAHSAGADAVNHMHRAIKKKGLDIRFDHVLFGAPASTYWLTCRGIVENAHLSNQYTIAMMHDDDERKDPVLMVDIDNTKIAKVSYLLAILYPSSMLYVVSSMAEKLDFEENLYGAEKLKDIAILGMDRFRTGDRYKKLSWVSEVQEFLTSAKVSTIITKPGNKRGPFKAIDHGHFFINDPKNKDGSPLGDRPLDALRKIIGIEEVST